MDKFEINESEFQPAQKKGHNQDSKSILNYLPDVVMAIMLIAMSSLSTLFQYDFAIKEIVWSSFIIMLVLRCATLFMSRYIGADLRYSKDFYSEETAELRQKYINEGKDIDACEFESWLNEYNKTYKISLYKKNMQVKISNAESKLRNYKYSYDANPKRATQRKIEDLERYIQELYNLIDEEYIEKNISSIKVKGYNPLRISNFLSSNTESDGYKDVYAVNVKKEMGEEISKSIPFTIVLTLLSSTIAMSYTTGDFNIISMLMDLICIALNFSLGWAYVAPKTLAHLKSVYINRYAFLKKFKTK